MSSQKNRIFAVEMTKNEAISMKYIKSLLVLFVLVFTMSSCGNSEEPVPVKDNDKTVLMYLPWSTNLTSYFYQNIKDMEACIESMGGLSDQRVLVFLSESPTEASLFEIKIENGACQRVPLKSYQNPAVTTKDGIVEILDDMKTAAPARTYSMIIGCHGMGWLPVNSAQKSRSTEKFHWDYDSSILTRYFGGTTADFQTDISTLADAISSAGLKMEYILFDDCYMSSIEVAYELKDVTDYLIASTCEVMAYGMPYETMGRHLLGTPDYAAVCDDFYEFYSNYTAMPCGTLSVTDLAHIDQMAALMKRINTSCVFDENWITLIQNLDGYSPTIFYDFGDYVSLIIDRNQSTPDLAAEFKSQLDRLILYKTHTDRFYTASRGPLKLNRYSGITTSEPSTSRKAADKTTTKWYRATH